MNRFAATNAPDAVPVSALEGVGPSTAEKLGRLGIRTIQDLLFHMPAHYEDRTRITPISRLGPGVRAVVEGSVEHTRVRLGRRQMLECRLSDTTSSLLLRFFHFSARQHRALDGAQRLRCFGEVRTGANGLEMIHPEYRCFEPEVAGPLEKWLTAIYPTTEGLHQSSIRALCDQALEWVEHQGGLIDWLPLSVREHAGLPGLENALRYLHHPPADAPLVQLAARSHPAQRRLIFEELLAHHLSLRQVRHALREGGAPAVGANSVQAAALRERLPFVLTRAQNRVVEEIVADLHSGRPMLRLLLGDVGSGKTVVAALCALHVLESGYQVAVMAPTDILAEQHHASLAQLLVPMGLKVVSLASRVKGGERQQTLEQLRAGDVDMVVGTHALFQKAVHFERLGLIIVDEQHRFGVLQRLALRDKGAAQGRLPHQLIMTATPIPRTLAMTTHADLDCSVIDELPAGRQPVSTVAVSDARRSEVLQRVEVACNEGRQAYWVCTLIEASEALQCENAETAATRLREGLPDVRVGLIHGRMKSEAKDGVMRAFKNGELGLLVATTVIEVGVDVPNASLMVIENAERLGLAQLHQLRGRIGRGTRQSHCVLMYHPPLSATARRRLQVLRETTDGFRIAREDLALRGPGEVLGKRQSGALQFRLANLVRDEHLLPSVQWAGELILEQYQSHVSPLVSRWVGEGSRYGQV